MRLYWRWSFASLAYYLQETAVSRLTYAVNATMLKEIIKKVRSLFSRQQGMFSVREKTKEEVQTSQHNPPLIRQLVNLYLINQEQAQAMIHLHALDFDVSMEKIVLNSGLIAEKNLARVQCFLEHLRTCNEHESENDENSVGLIVFSRTGQIETCNRAIEMLFGFKSAEIAERHLSTLFVASNGERDAELLEQVKRDALNTFVDVKMLSQDGTAIDSEVGLTKFGTEAEEQFLLNIVKVRRSAL